MSERHPTPGDPTGFPDVDDPDALAAWLDNIEETSGRIAVRQRHVLDMAEATHDIFMLNTQPLPLWECPADRYRAWTILGAGMALSASTGMALVGFGPDHLAALAPFLIACLIWCFVAAAETARHHRHRTHLRVERDTRVLAATERRDAAAALLEQIAHPNPTDT